ncbi:Ras-specific guanine nucleotide-releasing factor 2 [Chelonia mydas]|uniref:Ras-specific guanine nucleotide-releasing factor 2 n=1 Tax=Chelonia mydas TaxID=8469 RepID=M7BMW5_CHEMY|nr:Ras-specific guanine nucleotide-releasing factor 2 [Chelonia mydas]
MVRAVQGAWVAVRSPRPSTCLGQRAGGPESSPRPMSPAPGACHPGQLERKGLPTAARAPWVAPGLALGWATRVTTQGAVVREMPYSSAELCAASWQESTANSQRSCVWGHPDFSLLPHGVGTRGGASGVAQIMLAPCSVPPVSGGARSNTKHSMHPGHFPHMGCAVRRVSGAAAHLPTSYASQVQKVAWMQGALLFPPAPPPQHSYRGIEKQRLRGDQAAVPATPWIQSECPKPECFETLSAMELAEQITLLDHIVFRSIPYEEFLGQGWMKLDKNERTPYIMKTSQHFNDMSNLVASQIMNYADVGSRANSIEKWVAVADICRCMHNYNGVLEITSAFNRSAIYRLKKTWAKVSKQTKALMDKLQKTVSSEGRFKNLRETLKNCNPPAVPYLGMYLTDLAFIEEGTPNFTEEGLVNFSKMRMISHIIREIRQFQQTSYRIEHQQKVTHYLLDKTLIIDEDTLYELSLKIEPRLPA